METKRKILIADDDESILEVTRILLEAEGYEITTVNNGEQAIAQIDDSYDLLILDIMMPACSGITACMEIRKKYMIPILFLTAKSTDADKVIGFSAGGDDYLSKPFSYPELLSRVKALIRRYHTYNNAETLAAAENTNLKIHDIRMCLETHRVYKGETEIQLTDIEYQILYLLAANKNKIFSVKNIYESVWNEPYFSSSNNTVTVHIRNLRKKLGEDGQETKYILNVWGRGYRIV